MTRTYPIAQPGDDDCPTCGAPDVAWPTCKECGAMDLGYLHNLVRPTILDLETRRNDDGSWSVAA